MVHPTLRFETLTGPALEPFLSDLAALRIAVFREWPYLYEGDAVYERGYLRSYAESPGAAVIVAFDGEKPVGAATCQPMTQTHGPVADTFRAAGYDVGQWCYFGESVLLSAYRGQGAGVRFFAEREAHAQRIGLDRCTFCAVIREPTHPLKPRDYLPLDAFWMKRGYAKRPDLVCHFDWNEIGAEAETSHPLAFWVKSLSGQVIG
ncbi:GNAT family N-acetyltransferase [Acetobacteraceae bacterium H6797]|nr:GNAT family N-acetyltransferase [Acetobacteraceae bacterium H6797]